MSHQKIIVLIFLSSEVGLALVIRWLHRYWQWIGSYRTWTLVLFPAVLGPVFLFETCDICKWERSIYLGS